MCAAAPDLWAAAAFVVRSLAELSVELLLTVEFVMASSRAGLVSLM
jgi:hypothetical protein